MNVVKDALNQLPIHKDLSQTVMVLKDLKTQLNLVDSWWQVYSMSINFMSYMTRRNS